MASNKTKFQEAGKGKVNKTRDDILDLRITIAPKSRDDKTKENITGTILISKSKVSDVETYLRGLLFG